ncbi:uncharacterized protein LOC116518859 [Thamnophis elegans]|uniref:uncharacterized protein LOC116518859 n=1 Tax=Thamnophis elegans TaxID=35005 RepID=UPI00137707BD|nr:uncharacterized protein LOC116518859 [Thamnophis elegans]
MEFWAQRGEAPRLSLFWAPARRLPSALPDFHLISLVPLRDSEASCGGQQEALPARHRRFPLVGSWTAGTAGMELPQAWQERLGLWRPLGANKLPLSPSRLSGVGTPWQTSLLKNSSPHTRSVPAGMEASSTPLSTSSKSWRLQRAGGGKARRERGADGNLSARGTPISILRPCRRNARAPVNSAPCCKPSAGSWLTCPHSTHPPKVCAVLFLSRQGQCKKASFQFTDQGRPGTFKTNCVTVTQILDTDYKTYIITYVVKGSSAFLTLAAKEKTLSEALRTKFANLAASVGISGAIVPMIPLEEC